MNDTENSSPYASPSAELIQQSNDNKSILEFKRFSAWGVAGLSIITLGIYPVYWLWSRAEIINRLHDKKITKPWLIALVTTTIVSTVMSLVPSEDPTFLIVSSVMGLAYFVPYIVVLFRSRNNLQDIMGAENNQTYKLNGVLTFFASTIYLQYKINECIDNTVSVSQEES